MTNPLSPRAPFLSRFHAYLDERFPIVPSLLTAFLLAGTADVVSQASMARVAALDLRTALSTSFVFCFLFVLRVLDEHKDEEVDRIAHPERVLQRGIVLLRELDVAALLATLLLLAVAASGGLPALVAAICCLAYLGLMRVEFFAPTFLRTRLLLYAVSHQVITPLLCFAVVIARAGDHPGPPSAASTFQAFTAALLGLVFEIGRKVRAPEEEIAGDDTYSSNYGPARAALFTAVCGLAAAGAATSVCVLLHAHPAAAGPAVLGALLVTGVFLRFAHRPRAGSGKALLGAVASGALLTYGSVALAAFWRAP